MSDGSASVRKSRLVFIPILTFILNLLRLKGRKLPTLLSPDGGTQERETITYLSFLLAFNSPVRSVGCYLPAISEIKQEFNKTLRQTSNYGHSKSVLCKHIFCNNTFNDSKNFYSSSIKRSYFGFLLLQP